MRSLQESLLDDEEDLIDNTNALSAIDFPKYSDLNTTKISYSKYVGERGTTNKSYQWIIPKNLRKKYIIKDSKFENAHPNFIPYTLTTIIDPSHQYLGLKLDVTEINTFYKHELAEEYDINLFIWNNSFRTKNKYRVLAYNVLELLATYPEALQFILIDNNPQKDFNFYFPGIDVDFLFDKFNWKIKNYK